MRTFIVCSTFAPPKRIHANDDKSAISHYATAYKLNGGRPVEGEVRYRVYDADSGVGKTIH